MKVKELLALIPEKDLMFLAAETKVDHQVKKLNGIVMFQLILFTLLDVQKASLRMMEEVFSSMKFKIISGIVKDASTKFNSISDRIATINPDFFEKIFIQLFEKFNQLLGEKDAIIRYDSTMIAISSKLVEWGMKAGSKTDKVQLKYTIATKGSLPCDVKIFDESNNVDENTTIPNTILGNDISLSGIVVFDRGVSGRKAFNLLNDNNRKFVTRIKTDSVYKVVKENKVDADFKKENQTIAIHEDLIIYLRETSKGWTKNKFRLIKATIISTQQPIYFLSNIEDIDAYEIAAIYRQRWDIEQFFRFIKQHLNATHLVARNKNGIRVMIYMTLILSILIIVYKNFNKLSTYKMAKLKFSLELERALTKQIVILSGGDPDKLPQFFNDV
ncbi:MAG: IS4 family transposase [Pseudomonadota bacterium]